jgi:hypothetical protein
MYALSVIGFQRRSHIMVADKKTSVGVGDFLARNPAYDRKGQRSLFVKPVQREEKIKFTIHEAGRSLFPTE